MRKSYLYRGSYNNKPVVDMTSDTIKYLIVILTTTLLYLMQIDYKRNISQMFKNVNKILIKYVEKYFCEF